MAAHVVRVTLVVSPGQQYLTRSNVAAEVIHMAVGFVVEQAVRQPDDLVHGQVRTQYVFDFFA